MRPRALIFAVFAAAFPLPALSAGDGCHKMWPEQFQLCPTHELPVIERSAQHEGVFFVGPIPHPDIWRGIVFALGPTMKQGESVRKAVDWHMDRALRSPELTVDILSRRDLTVDGRASHLVVQKVSTPNGSSYLKTAILGLQYGKKVAVVEVQETNFEDDALLAEWATKVSAMIMEDS